MRKLHKPRKLPQPVHTIRVKFEDYEDTPAAADLFRAIRKAQAVTRAQLDKERKDEPAA
jgi:hypothetical protein